MGSSVVNNTGYSTNMILTGEESGANIVGTARGLVFYPKSKWQGAEAVKKKREQALRGGVGRNLDLPGELKVGRSLANFLFNPANSGGSSYFDFTEVSDWSQRGGGGGGGGGGGKKKKEHDLWLVVFRNLAINGRRHSGGGGGGGPPPPPPPAAAEIME